MRQSDKIKSEKRDLTPRFLSIGARDWSLFMRELAAVAAAQGSDTVPLTLKTAYAGAGAFVVAGAVGIRSVSALAVKPATGAVATGAKTGAKLGLKAWGPVVAVVVTCWEVWDHRRDVAENLPLLRRDLNSGLDAIASTILNCPATGLKAMIADLETRLRHGVDSGIARRK